jgi:hypothetical protein
MVDQDQFLDKVDQAIISLAAHYFEALCYYSRRMAKPPLRTLF